MAHARISLKHLPKLRVTPYALNEQAGAHQQISTLAKDQPKAETDSERMSTFLPVETNSQLPPNMRQWSRWDYLNEFIHYWKWGIITKVMSVALIVLAVVTLPVFWPGSLVMLLAAGRLGSLSWMYNFIFWNFGKYRSLVIVD